MSIAATTVFEVRTTGSDTQCAGGFNSARGGTDYSQQNAAQATGTVTSSTTTVTATTGIFTSAMVGNLITDGTTFKEITAFTSSTVVTVDSAPSWTAATVYVGGAMATPAIACNVAIGGNTVWIKSGTYTATTSTTNVSGGVANVPSSSPGKNTTLLIVGYGSSRGDLGTKPIITASGITGVYLFSFNTSVKLDNLDFRGASLAIGALRDAANPMRLICVRCKFSGFAGTVLAPGNGATWRFRACEFTTNSATVANNNFNVVFFYCTFHDNTASPLQIGSGTLDRCLFYNNTGSTTDGVSLGDGGNTYITGCTFYGNGRDGIRFGTNSNTNFFEVVNTIAAGNGGVGINISNGSCDQITVQNCAVYGNTGGNVSSNIFAGVENLVTLTGNPFTNAASGDFSLNNTAGAGKACRAAGVPGAFPGGTTTGYPDIGAVQHADAGGIMGGGGWDGGFGG